MRRFLVGVVASVGFLLAGPVPVAMGQDDLDLSVGWVLRSADTGEFHDAGDLAGTRELGYVVLGDASLLYSRDGLSWDSVDTDVLPSDLTDIVDITAGERGFVAIGGFRSGDPVSVFFSADGRNWERIDSSTLPLSTLSIRGSLVRAAAGPNGFVVSGVEECDAFAWFSPDGLSWSSADFPSECGNLLVTPHRTGWVATGSSEDGVIVFSSTDGVTWTDLEAAAPPPAEALSRDSLASDGATLVLAGATLDESDTAEVASLWVSTDDGNNWVENRLTPSAEGGASEVALFPLTVNDLGFMGTFYRETSGGLVAGSIVFSADGSTWNEYPAETIFFDIVSLDESLVALGSEGVYTWTPPGTELLPQTGANTDALLTVGAGLVLVGVVILRARTSPQHRQA